ncbi:hypothetical protein Tco_0903062 [Tanacetum coccineum]
MILVLHPKQNKQVDFLKQCYLNIKLLNFKEGGNSEWILQRSEFSTGLDGVIRILVHSKCCDIQAFVEKERRAKNSCCGQFKEFMRKISWNLMMQRKSGKPSE